MNIAKVSGEKVGYSRGLKSEKGLRMVYVRMFKKFQVTKIAEKNEVFTWAQIRKINHSISGNYDNYHEINNWLM